MRAHGKRLIDRARGVTELRCDESTLRLLATRQVELSRALLGRGHAAMDAVQLGARSSTRELPKAVMNILAAAQVQPHWSTLRDDGDALEPDRQRAVDQLALAVNEMLEASS